MRTLSLGGGCRHVVLGLLLLGVEGLASLIVLSLEALARGQGAVLLHSADAPDNPDRHNHRSNFFFNFLQFEKLLLKLKHDFVSENIFYVFRFIQKEMYRTRRR